MFECAIQKLPDEPILIVTNQGTFQDFNPTQTNAQIAAAIREHGLARLGLVVDNRLLITNFNQIADYITLSQQDKGEGSPADPRIIAAAYVADTVSLYGLASHFFAQLYKLNVKVFVNLDDALYFVREQLRNSKQFDPTNIQP